MKSADIVNNLRIVLGSISTRYGTALTPSNVSNTGSVVDISFPASHNLKDGAAVIVSGIAQTYSLSKIVIANKLVVCETVLPHDLTLNDPARPNARVDGLGVTEIDGIAFPLVDVPNRKTFILDISGLSIQPADLTAENVGILIDDYSNRFTGVFPVEVMTPVSIRINAPFPVEDNSALLTNVSVVQNTMRISSCATIERFYSAYTKQTPGAVYLVVILGDQSISRDRAIVSDATNVRTSADSGIIREVQTVDIFALIPTREELLGSDAKDLACNEIKRDLTKALAGWAPPIDYGCKQKYVLTPVSNGTAIYDGAIYAHRYTFEVSVDITRQDMYIYTGDRAFRDIDLSLASELGGL